MPLYPYHSVNGVPMSDSAGRWTEAPDQEFIASFPGLQSTELALPGYNGSRTLKLAPLNGTKFTLKLFIHAVEDGALQSTVASRKRAIEANYRELLGKISVAAGTNAGTPISITRYFAATDMRVAYGRVIAASEVEYDPYSDYARVALVFDIPDGSWRSVESPISTVTGSGDRKLTNHAGTIAPIQDAWLGLFGPWSNPIVKNVMGEGFQLNQSIPSGKAVLVNASNWTYSMDLASDFNWSTSMQATQRVNLKPVGHTSGPALMLIPIAGEVTVNTNAPSGAQLQVRAQKAF